jgi:hypothetical protein
VLLTVAQAQTIEALVQAKARYLRLMDTKDWNGLRETIGEAARFHPPQMERNSYDPTEWVTTLRDRLDAAAATVHRADLPAIGFLEDGRASGSWPMGNLMYWHGDPNDRAFRNYGYYREEFRKAADGTMGAV